MVAKATAQLAIYDDLRRGEEPILLCDLTKSKLIPTHGGRRPHRRCPFRWASRGVRGVKIEAIKTPGGLATTPSAVLRFFAALSGHHAPTAETALQRSRRAAQVESALEQEGL